MELNSSAILTDLVYDELKVANIELVSKLNYRDSVLSAESDIIVRNIENKSSLADSLRLSVVYSNDQIESTVGYFHSLGQADITSTINLDSLIKIVFLKFDFSYGDQNWSIADDSAWVVVDDVGKEGI